MEGRNQRSNQCFLLLKKRKKSTKKIRQIKNVLNGKAKKGAGAAIERKIKSASGLERREEGETEWRKYKLKKNNHRTKCEI